MPTEKQNEGEEKCENQPAARQNQNKDTNISMGIWSQLTLQMSKMKKINGKYERLIKAMLSECLNMYFKFCHILYSVYMNSVSVLVLFLLFFCITVTPAVISY